MILSFQYILKIKKKDPINSNSIFYNDSFNGLSADLQQSYLNYSNKFLKIKIGRDFFIPGKYFNDRLMFSSIGLPYDRLQLLLSRKNYLLVLFILN